jgi:hypothetical protein
LLGIEPQAMASSQEISHVKADVVAVLFVGFAWVA